MWRHYCSTETSRLFQSLNGAGGGGEGALGVCFDAVVVNGWLLREECSLSLHEVCFFVDLIFFFITGVDYYFVGIYCRQVPRSVCSGR